MTDDQTAKLIELSVLADELTTKVETLETKLNQVKTSALSAIVKAEDCLLELNNATFGITESRGRKLGKLFMNIREEFASWDPSAPPPGS